MLEHELKLFPAMVDALDHSMLMSEIALVMPARTILFTLHNWLTNRDYSYSLEDLFDMLLLGMLLWWYEKYYEWAALPYNDLFAQTPF